MKEIWYFIQWYFNRQLTKIKKFNYKFALWHLSALILIPSSFILTNTSDGELVILSGRIMAVTFIITCMWYFIKLWFFWDWLDYQREKQKTFDILNDHNTN